MFCPKCGAENTENAGFCQKCGSALTQTASPTSSYSGSSQSAKSPIIAAVLNLFFGVGYLYLGYKKVLGIQTILFVIIMFILFAVIGTFTLGLLELLLAEILAIDGNQKGQGQKGFIGAEL